jgi:hypothetical protein
MNVEEYVSDYKEYEDTLSYAKLEGPTFKYFLYKLNVILGREKTGVDPISDEQIIFIGNSQKISRKHAKIYWNFDNMQWEIKILSKNKAIVGSKTLRQHDPPIILQPCTPITIDNFKFYFFPACREIQNQ